TKLDRFTGKLVWRKNYVSDLSAPGFVVKSSRNTPYVKGDLVIVGSNMGLIDRLCRMTGGTPSALGCASGDGAIVLAINKNTGQIRWKRHTNIGNDPDHELPQELRALLGPKGSFGTSTYGHNPTVDVARRQVYVATAQTTTAPQVAQDCEQARRTSGNPNANI